MSGMLNFLTIVLFIVAQVGFDFFKQFEDRLFSVQRSAAFLYYSVDRGLYPEGHVCRPDILNHPLLSPRERALDCR